MVLAGSTDCSCDWTPGTGPAYIWLRVLRSFTLSHNSLPYYTLSPSLAACLESTAVLRVVI